MGGDGADTVCFVVPCFNEEARLRVEELCVLGADPRVSVIVVDDGSTDGTLELVRSMAPRIPRLHVVRLDRNRGKGEAVRAGLVASRDTGSAWVGYVDADMSTPARELLRLIDVALASPGHEVVLGTRVALLGRDVRRSPFRHYTGRGFATLASWVLSKPVYDTQCGAKLFRRTEEFERSIDQPFRSRWAFDVEVLGRLDAAGVPPASFWEEPLLVWHDARGSRRTVLASMRASVDLLAIWRDLCAVRRARGGRR